MFLDLSLLRCAFAGLAFLLKLVDLRREDEIALGQAVDLVRPDLDLRDTPTETDVRMMTLLFRKITYAIHEIERLAKV